MADSFSDQKKKIKEVNDEVGNLSKTVADFSKTSKKSFGEVVTGIKDLTKKSSEQIEREMDVVIDSFTGGLNKISSMIGNLPFGDSINKLMDIEGISSEFESSIKESLQQGITEGLTGAATKKIAEAGGKALMTLGKRLITTFTNPWVIAGVLVVAMIARFVQFDKIMGEIRDKTGFTGKQMKEISYNIKTANLDLVSYGVTMEMVAESAVALNEAFGNIAFLTKNNIETVSMMSKVLGVGAGEAAKMYQTFLNMSGGSSKIAKNMIAVTKATADAVGISPQLVFQDIAGSSEKIFEVTNGLPETISRTAIEARRLGLNLDTALGIAENLLNFESSIESQLNASVLTGRQLNLEQARYLAAVGKTDEMLVEVSKQFGDIEQFSRMLPFQQKALAGAIGLSAGQLRNMLSTQKQLDDLAKGTVSTFDAFQEGASFEDVLKTKDALTPLEDLWASTKAILVSISEILMPVVKILIPAFKALAAIFTFIADVLRVTIVPIFAFLGNLVEKFVDSIMLSFKLLWDFIKRVFSGDNLADIFSDMLDVIIAWNKEAFAYILQPFVDAWEFLFGNTIWSAENIKAIFDEILAVMRVVGEAIVSILIMPFEIVWEKVKSIFGAIGDIIGGTIGTVANLFGGGGGVAMAPAIVGAGIAGTQAGILAGDAGVATAETAAGEKISLQDVVDKLDILINVFSSGVDMKMNGAKVGEFLAKSARK